MGVWLFVGGVILFYLLVAFIYSLIGGSYRSRYDQTRHNDLYFHPVMDEIKETYRKDKE